MNSRCPQIKTLLLLIAVASSGFAVELECTFSDVTWVDVGSRYTCTVLVTKTSPANKIFAEVTQVSGTHKAGYDNEAVEAFKSTGEVTSSGKFLRNLERFFPNLIVINLSGSTVSSISAINLIGLPNLTVLSLEENGIITIDADLFQYSPKLTRINFSENPIEFVGANLLSNLNQLTYADFRENDCIDMLATTPQKIESLKAKLLKECLPSETAESAECLDPRCAINEEVDYLKDFSIYHSALIEKLLERIAELEMQVHEMGSNPATR